MAASKPKKSPPALLESLPPTPSRPIQVPSALVVAPPRLPSPILISPLPISQPSSPPVPVTPWWADRSRESRPWQNTNKRRRTIPEEQTEAFNKTALAVSRATGVALRTAGNVAREALVLGADVLQFAPVVGLSEAAKVLLSIWNAVEQVETNRLACLGLTERCADILRTVHEEVLAAGGEVVDTLVAPVQKLTEVFASVEHVVQKQAERPFLKRYLKRDDITAKIQACHAQLTDAVSMFSITIQIRMLKALQAAEAARQQDNAELLNLLLNTRTSDPSHVLPTLEKFRQAQFLLDSHRDREDLLQTMRIALRTSNDADLINILQVQKHEIPEAVKTMERALEDPEQTSDPFHKEFLETGIEAMRRLSGDQTEPLPSWTITRWEIDREEQIGVGFFSDVYKGTWRGHPVAIKIMAMTTPSRMFLREVEIWKSLKHENVVQLYGASSTSSNPPWFCVSPYLKNGSVVRFLKQSPGIVDPLRMIHEIAVGMDYLHGRGVFHGDLKACNVLIDDNLHCQISDFGQSEMKSEVYRLSGTPVPTKGTLRWLAPEAIMGQRQLTQAVDVWAFSITCIEILTDGDLPWPLLDDQMVWHLVIVRDERPLIPHTHSTTLGLSTLIERCWARNPETRPPFQVISTETKILLNGIGTRDDDTPRRPNIALPGDSETHTSPGLQPLPDSDLDVPPPWGEHDNGVRGLSVSPNSDATGISYKTAEVQPWSIPIQQTITPNAGTPLPPNKELIPASPTTSIISGKSSSATITTEDEVDELGYESPPPEDSKVAARRNERRYRLNLDHSFHPSLVLPLWTPTVVALGDIGYLEKPSGKFITLCNAFNPSRHNASLPTMQAVIIGVQRKDTRTMTQRGIDMIKEGLLTFISRSETYSTNVARRYSFPLRAGHRRSILVAETTTYRYLDDLDTPKAWFTANIGTILKLYGKTHRLQKGDVYFVLGSLEAQDWGLFVNHSHPDGQVHFNVFSERHTGREWGVFSTDTDLSTTSGPHYHENSPTAKLSANKISIRKEPKDAEWSSLILARLRFKPDTKEPTSH